MQLSVNQSVINLAHYIAWVLFLCLSVDQLILPTVVQSHPCVCYRAVGYKLYGNQYHDQLTETVRRAAEHCDCLQSFFILHSMGGGTGSGVGTRVLEILQNEYPDVYRYATGHAGKTRCLNPFVWFVLWGVAVRFVTAVFPSADDDVITSPYNWLVELSLN